MTVIVRERRPVVLEKSWGFLDEIDSPCRVIRGNVETSQLLLITQVEASVHDDGQARQDQPKPIRAVAWAVMIVAAGWWMRRSVVMA